MIRWIRDRKETRRKARSLYFAAVTQARDPAFYQECGVPDTLDGRFEMACLHVALIIRVLEICTDKQAKALSQALFDHMFKVTDQTIREMGIGDLSVPRHMKRMMSAFNGRAYSYDKALTDEQGLEDALIRNVYGTVETPDPLRVAALTGYVTQSAQMLTIDDIFAEKPVFARVPGATAHERELNYA